MRNALGLVLLVGVVGCGDDDDGLETREEIILSLTPDLVAGEAGYGTHCAACHAADGSGGVGEAIAGEDAASAVEAMLDPPGGMSDFSDLTDQELADIAGYVESL